MEQSGHLPPNTGIERSSPRITPESMGRLKDHGRQYFNGVRWGTLVYSNLPKYSHHLTTGEATPSVGFVRTESLLPTLVWRN